LLRIGRCEESAVEVPEMTNLLQEINALIDEPGTDRTVVERALTDGYAHALELESQRWRLQRRVEELTLALGRGDAPTQTKELTRLAKQLDGNAGDLSRLRSVLAELRRRSSSLF
jgi:hypothetical protein